MRKDGLSMKSLSSIARGLKLIIPENRYKLLIIFFKELQW